MTAAAERGATVIADRVVRRIAERAATESLPGRRVDVRRASASVRGPRAEVSVTVSVPYPQALEEAGDAVQAYVGGRTQELTGLTVRAPRVHIAALTPARDGPLPATSWFTPEAWKDGGTGRARRLGVPALSSGPEVPLEHGSVVPERRAVPRGDGEGASAEGESAPGDSRSAPADERAAPAVTGSDGEGSEASSALDRSLREPAPMASAARPSRLGRRVWAARRLPTAIVSLVVAVCFALLLSDVVAVHAVGHSPARWRTRLLDELEHHGPGQVGVTAAAAVAVIAGIWLLVLAFTPGRRELLVMAPFTPDPRVGRGLGLGLDPGPGPDLGPGFGSGSKARSRLWLRAAVECRTAACAVRDAVADVPGVTGARAKVSRRRVRVRAQIAFGDCAVVRAAAVAAAEQALKEMDLVRPPRLRCAVRAAPYWRPAQPTAGPRKEAVTDGQNT